MKKRVISAFLAITMAISFLVFPGYGAVGAHAEEIPEEETMKDSAFSNELSMYYDDHLDLTGKTVEIIDAGKPESFKVGFGIEEGTPDEEVLKLEGNTLIAAGTGKAQIKIDDEICDVTVKAAPISLLLLAGQSNMEGLNGNPDQSILCPQGQVYESFGDLTILNRYTAAYLAPSALTGEYRTVNTKGTTEYLCDYPVYVLTEEGPGKAGPDSGLAYEWIKATGEKVWLVNTSHSSASLNTFQKYCNNYEAAQFLFTACEETLKKEIAAGHFVLSHMGMFWCQGCADDSQSASWYVSKFTAMYNDFKKDMSVDLDNDPNTPDNTLEFADIIMAMAGSSKRKGYRRGSNRPESAGFYSTFLELEMRGHRVGQYWMAANPDYPDVNVVCNLAESWVTMPDGTDGVKAYFESHYENGTVDYPTHKEQSDKWRTPEQPKDVKNSIHYKQIGYNEIGREAAKNACILLGYLEDTDEKTIIRFVDWTGYQEIKQVPPSTNGVSGTLVVPVVTPVYRMKTADFSITTGLKYEYFDLLTENYKIQEGMLSANDQENAVVAVRKD